MRKLRAPAVALLAYAAIAVAMTWPLASRPGRLAIPNGDLFGHAWGLGWVVHQALRQPLRLYDANMYFPHTLSLAYTESLIPQALAAAPILLTGGDPLLAYNVVLLLTLALCGLGAFLLAYELCRSRQGAFLAGLGYAFCAHHWLHVAHLGVLSIQWLPFALLFLRRAVRRPRWPNLLGLLVFSGLQILSSGYYAVLLAIALAAALLHYSPAALRGGSLVLIVLSLALAGLVALPFGLPYRALQQRHAIERSRQECIHWSARPASYLYPGQYVGAGLPHARFLWSAMGAPGLEPLYPGIVALSLAGAGLLLGWRRETTRLAALLLVAGALFSFGPEIRIGAWSIPGPFELLRRVPPANMMRAPSRLGVLALLAIDLLAAIGWGRLSLRHPRRTTLAGLVGVATLMAVEAFPFGLAGRFSEAPAPPPFTSWLAAAPRGAVLELPWDRRRDSGLYMYWSTAHWQPMVNGHGTFSPPGNRDLALLGRRWPQLQVARVFRDARIRYVIVHTDRLSPGQKGTLFQGDGRLPQGVTLAAELGSDRIYVIEPETSASSRPPGRIGRPAARPRSVTPRRDPSPGPDGPMP